MPENVYFRQGAFLKAAKVAARPPRPAFTLTEMLVVLAILGTLVALSGAGMSKIAQLQSRRNSETTVRKVYSLLKQHWSAVIQEARDDVRRGLIPPQVLQMAGNDTERAKVIWIKLKLRQQFPMTYQEAVTPNTTLFSRLTTPYSMPAEKEYVDYLKNYIDVGAPPVPRSSNQMGVCLLMALKRVRRGIPENTMFGSEEIASVSLEKDVFLATDPIIPALVDDWGTPLGFYRWPFGNPEVDGRCPAGSAADLRDVQDPSGLLMADGWYTTNFAPERTDFERMCHPIKNGVASRNYYMVPVIVSAGANKKFGIQNDQMRPDAVAPIATMDQWLKPDPAQDTANDNIYSFLFD